MRGRNASENDTESKKHKTMDVGETVEQKEMEKEGKEASGRQGKPRQAALWAKKRLERHCRSPTCLSTPANMREQSPHLPW